ncbi:ADP-ribosylglycohydrolase family protein [Marinomonas ostreistagni]|uniref:ADP-ribosylglycohydrolase family protein n=1 Tax=Marinomonas ostreistagni TaxID=359209 RepID=A0ABS0ZE84_9GAMM|nr:ADP-ribosylglycohydrolase family protein [Marinomonas ostreistagni]MBJ7551983.1 ADP-ribosylglycohydrolase family protein [Marinomonas ostreistagni]
MYSLATLWCFCHSASFEDAILLAADLRDKADTTAAVYGQIVGAFKSAKWEYFADLILFYFLS